MPMPDVARGGPAACGDCRVHEVEAELRTFSYIVSHDLSASVRHVSEFSRLLIRELGDDLTGPQQAHADRIKTTSQLCQAMMEQLLVYSRVQQKPLKRISQDGLQAMRRPLLNLAMEAREADAEFAFEPLGEVYADPALLEMVMQQLIDNAIKFRNPAEKLRVSAAPAHDEGFWRVRIQDNGSGVEPIYHEKAFQMFARLNGGETRPGVGAGLAICRRIARRHGGDLAFVASDIGACVELSLPHEGAAP